MVSQVVGEPVVPAVMVNEPAESVEPEVMEALGPVPPPQLLGVPMVGAVVWVVLKWAFVSVREAKVLVLPAIVITELVESAFNSVILPAAFWMAKAAAESV